MASREAQPINMTLREGYGSPAVTPSTNVPTTDKPRSAVPKPPKK
jgi:hypothetical protein